MLLQSFTYVHNLYVHLNRKYVSFIYINIYYHYIIFMKKKIIHDCLYSYSNCLYEFIFLHNMISSIHKFLKFVNSRFFHTIFCIFRLLTLLIFIYWFTYTMLNCKYKPFLGWTSWTCNEISSIRKNNDIIGNFFFFFIYGFRNIFYFFR